MQSKYLGDIYTYSVLRTPYKYNLILRYHGVLDIC